MTDPQSLGRILVVAGLILLACGALLLWGDGGAWLKGLWERLPLGRLPGDITIDRPGLRVSFPLMTCLVISAVISLLLYLFRK